MATAPACLPLGGGRSLSIFGDTFVALQTQPAARGRPVLSITRSQSPPALGKPARSGTLGGHEHLHSRTYVFSAKQRLVLAYRWVCLQRNSLLSAHANALHGERGRFRFRVQRRATGESQQLHRPTRQWSVTSPNLNTGGALYLARPSVVAEVRTETPTRQTHRERATPTSLPWFHRTIPPRPIWRCFVCRLVS